MRAGFVTYVGDMPSGDPPPSLPHMNAPQPARADAGPEVLDSSWLADQELVDPAYAQTMADTGIQTSLPPPEPVPEPPAWLINFFNAVGEFFTWSAPVLKYVLWALVVLLVLFLAYRFIPGFAEWVDARRRPVEQEAEEIGVVEAQKARARLADADALASEGRFAEAVHLLLYRSVDDIAARRPGLVKPALTARDLAAARELPGAARGAFAHIARAVEISLFGGRSIDSAVWHECRDAYTELTIPKNWATEKLVSA